MWYIGEQKREVKNAKRSAQENVRTPTENDGVSKVELH